MSQNHAANQQQHLDLGCKSKSSKSEAMVNASDATPPGKNPTSAPVKNDLVSPTVGSSNDRTRSDEGCDESHHQESSHDVDMDKLASACDGLNMNPVDEVQETRPGVNKLRSWLNKNIKVEISDGRFLVGTFLCTDRDSNVIIGLCNEYTRDPDLKQEHAAKQCAGTTADSGMSEEGRILGLAMVPGRHIKKLYIDDSPLVPSTSRAPTDSGSEGSCHS